MQKSNSFDLRNLTFRLGDDEAATKAVNRADIPAEVDYDREDVIKGGGVIFHQT